MRVDQKWRIEGGFVHECGHVWSVLVILCLVKRDCGLKMFLLEPRNSASSRCRIILDFKSQATKVLQSFV